MITLNISDELYTRITKTLNDTRNAKNSMTRELEGQQLCTDTAISELKHPSAVVELMHASDSAQANIELLNAILKQVAIKHQENSLAKAMKNSYPAFLKGHSNA